MRAGIQIDAGEPPARISAHRGEKREHRSPSGGIVVVGAGRLPGDTSAIDRVWRLHQGQSGATALLEALFEDYKNNIADLAAVADGLEG